MIVTYRTKELNILFHEVFFNFGGQLPGCPPFSGLTGVYKQEMVYMPPKSDL